MPNLFWKGDEETGKLSRGGRLTLSDSIFPSLTWQIYFDTFCIPMIEKHIRFSMGGQRRWQAETSCRIKSGYKNNDRWWTLNCGLKAKNSALPFFFSWENSALLAK